MRRDLFTFNIFIFQDEIAGTMGLAWIIVQHFLFGLIGAAVNISDIQANTAGIYQNFFFFLNY